jgi:structure-specific recognition protein 1
LIRFNDVKNVEFQRYHSGHGSTRTFDFAVFLKTSATVGEATREYIFLGIDGSDFAGLYNFVSGKYMKIKNLGESGIGSVATVPVYNEDTDSGMEEESEDESYDSNAAAKDDEGSGSELEDIEIDDDLDSDLEEYRGGKTKKKRKPADEGHGDEDKEEPPKKKSGGSSQG